MIRIAAPSAATSTDPAPPGDEHDAERHRQQRPLDEALLGREAVGCVRERPAPQAPDRERGGTADLVGDRVVPELARDRRSISDGGHRGREREREAGDITDAPGRGTAAARCRAGTAAPSASGANFVSPAKRGGDPAAGRPAADEQRHDEHQRHERVVAIGIEREQRERVGRPAGRRGRSRASGRGSRARAGTGRRSSAGRRRSPPRARPGRLSQVPLQPKITLNGT